jgi:hypothetical protein
MIEKLDKNNKAEAFDENWFKSQYVESLVDLKDKVKEPETVISIDHYYYKGVQYPNPVMTAGEFSVISAPSKSKKSFFKTFLSGAYIGGNAVEYFDNIRGHRDSDYAIIDCDTEQSKYYAHRTFKRVEEITGSEYEFYYPFKMRHMSPEERVAFIDGALKSNLLKAKVKLIFIDGVADLIEDSNDLVMSNQIAQKLLQWTDLYDVHVCVVIHNAYNTLKPTGHLGSVVVKKAETVMLLEPEDEEKRVIKVTHRYSRGRSFYPFYFTINPEDSLPYKCTESGDIKGFENNRNSLKSPVE